ncbi:MAG: hypothetical protein WKG06_26140 [Segetibacter sp.]
MNDQQQNNLRPTRPDHLTNETEANSNTNESTDTSAVYLGNSSLQTKAEFQKDKKGDHTNEDNTVTSSGVDNLQSKSDGAAGTDRAGTTERKTYGDTELNKGLEAQAKDEES